MLNTAQGHRCFKWIQLFLVKLIYLKNNQIRIKLFLNNIYTKTKASRVDYFTVATPE